jgi:hypothetical protein
MVAESMGDTPESGICICLGNSSGTHSHHVAHDDLSDMGMGQFSYPIVGVGEDNF